MVAAVEKLQEEEGERERRRGEILMREGGRGVEGKGVCSAPACGWWRPLFSRQISLEKRER
jgi:hypothetical protein